MVEFDIINSERKTGQTTYNIGYISPLALGRMSEISNSGQDKWLSGYSGSTDYTSGFYLINGQGLPNGGFLHLVNNELCTTSYGPMTHKGRVVDDGAWELRLLLNIHIDLTPLFGDIQIKLKGSLDNL